MKQRNKLGRSSMRKGYNLREKHSWYSKQCVQRPWGRITISTQCLWAARWSHWLERSEWQGSIGVEIREAIGSQVKYHGTHALLISASLTGLIPLNYRSILKFYGLSSPLPGGLLLTLMLLIPPNISKILLIVYITTHPGFLHNMKCSKILITLSLKPQKPIS